MSNDKILQKAKIQKFIQRLYAFVDDSEITDIYWSDSGTSIIIPDKEVFKKNTMRKISQTLEYTTFLRSLNHYGFIKLKRIQENSDEYYNQYFIRGKYDLLQNIKRINHKKGGCEIEDLKKDINYLQNSTNATTQNLYSVNEEINYLRSKIEKQEQTINGLIEVLSKAFRVGLANDNNVQPALKGNKKQLDNYMSSNEYQKMNTMHNNIDFTIDNQICYDQIEHDKSEMSKIACAEPVQKKRNVERRDAIAYQALKEAKPRYVSRSQENLSAKGPHSKNTYKSMPDFDMNKKDDNDDFFKDLFF